MGRNNYFQFKQFRIIQDKSAMKVGTDGALLGAWANVTGARTVLDVGAGTGLISLMIAQRCKADVLGVEIEKNAAEEASENVQRSPWKDRVSISNVSFQEFAAMNNEGFDLIVSNPPFFSQSNKNENSNRSIARHNHLLSFNDLLEGVVTLLNKNGLFSIILPNEPAIDFIEMARHKGLNLSRLTVVKPKATKNENRYLMEFSKRNVIVSKNTLIIYLEDSTDYTQMYKELTRDFYLNF